MSRYPRQVAELVDVYEGVAAQDTYRVVQTAPRTYIVEERIGQNAMNVEQWRRVDLHDRLARLLLDAYGHERSIVLDEEVADD